MGYEGIDSHKPFRWDRRDRHRGRVGWNDAGQADVLAVTKKGLLIETEVKMSMADLRRDRGKLKHRHFRDTDGMYLAAHFYFAVPRDMANKVCLACGQLYPYAGVLGVKGLNDYDVEVYRQPKMLGGKRLSSLQMARMARAQSATLCRLATEVADLKAKSKGGKVDE